ncbi:hypothetical protein Tco_1290855, partial [Tanacetum coccineum]
LCIQEHDDAVVVSDDGGSWLTLVMLRQWFEFSKAVVVDIKHGGANGCGCVYVLRSAQDGGGGGAGVIAAGGVGHGGDSLSRLGFMSKIGGFFQVRLLMMLLAAKDNTILCNLSPFIFLVVLLAADDTLQFALAVYGGRMVWLLDRGGYKRPVSWRGSTVSCMQPWRVAYSFIPSCNIKFVPSILFSLRFRFDHVKIVVGIFK